jgi:hypothetical protein
LYAENDNSLKQFGVAEGKSVDNGFVFVDGRYIESPYVISRRGLSLYVNNIKIKRPSRYSGMPVIPGYENPASLSWEEKQKLFRQLEAVRDIYEKYLNRKYAYLFFGKSGHVRLSPHTAAYDLPEVIESLTSDKKRDEKLTILRPHNWHLSGDMETFVDNFSVTERLLPRLHQLAEELLMVDEYGTMSEALVEEGFVFIGGKYIDAPYHIERRGLGVFINGKMVVRPCWVPEVIFSGNTDPEMPKEINSETCLYDEVVSNYLQEKQVYLHKHNTTRQEEAELMAQVYKNLPFITKAVVDESRPDAMDIETNDGMRITVGLNLLTRRVEYDRESVTKRVDSDRKYYQEALEKGTCFIMPTGGGKNGVSSEKLPKMISILNSKKSPSEKYSEMRQAGIHITDEELTELIANFSASPQLKLRIEKL